MFKVSLHDLKGDNLWKKKKKKNKKQKWITDGVVEIQLNQNVECTSGLSGRREKASVWGQVPKAVKTVSLPRLAFSDVTF